MSSSHGRQDDVGAGGKRTISQEAFDELVKENMDDLGMDSTEALEDALLTLSLQGVDLSGIVKVVPGEGASKDDPVFQFINRLKFSSEELNNGGATALFCELFDYLASSPTATPIAVKNGGIELLWSACLKLQLPLDNEAVGSGLKVLALLLYDLNGTEKFRLLDGPETVVQLLKDGIDCVKIVDGCFSVVAAAATGNEVVKELFMNLQIGEYILAVLNRTASESIIAMYDAIRVLLTPDDDRVVASQVYGYARRFAEIGIAEALVRSLNTGLAYANLASATIALKAVAVNDEICKSIAQSGGVDIILDCIDGSCKQGNGKLAKTCCSLLSKLAGSDSNKIAIVEKGRLNRLIQLANEFSGDATVLSEVMSLLAVVCLRSSDNARRVLEAGAGDLAIEAMEKFPSSPQVQRSSCLLIRNLVVRNPENRNQLLDRDVEKLIRKSKENHPSCREAASDALRDLGLHYK